MVSVSGCVAMLYSSLCCVALALVANMSQFSAFEVGQVKAHMHHGLGSQRISAILVKADGKTPFSKTETPIA